MEPIIRGNPSRLAHDMRHRPRCPVATDLHHPVAVAEAAGQRLPQKRGDPPVITMRKLQRLHLGPGLICRLRRTASYQQGLWAADYTATLVHQLLRKPVPR